MAFPAHGLASAIAQRLRSACSWCGEGLIVTGYSIDLDFCTEVCVSCPRCWRISKERVSYRDILLSYNGVAAFCERIADVIQGAFPLPRVPRRLCARRKPGRYLPPAPADRVTVWLMRAVPSREERLRALGFEDDEALVESNRRMR